MSEIDIANRELCPDGSCIGVIGPDGLCKECGAVGASVTTHSRNQGMNTRDERSEDDPGGTASPEFADRQLCVDELCVGVIGADGRCQECGRPGPSGAAEPPPAAEGRRDDDDVVDDDDEFGRRRLCVDELCVGLLGPDGRCKECGKSGI